MKLPGERGKRKEGGDTTEERRRRGRVVRWRSINCNLCARQTESTYLKISLSYIGSCRNCGCSCGSARCIVCYVLNRCLLLSHRARVAEQDESVQALTRRCDCAEAPPPHAHTHAHNAHTDLCACVSLRRHGGAAAALPRRGAAARPRPIGLHSARGTGHRDRLRLLPHARGLVRRQRPAQYALLQGAHTETQAAMGASDCDICAAAVMPQPYR